MIRQFTLTNVRGQTYDLLDRSGVMFFEPEGLGWEEDTDYTRIGNTFHALSDDFEQKEIEGTLVFPADHNPYGSYRNFVKFLRRSPLVLSYQTDVSDVFYIKVRAAEIEKTELNEFGDLVCPVLFMALGAFYKKEVAYNSGQILSGKVYPYQYNYVYSDAAPGIVDIYSDSVNNSPVKLTIFGPVQNPAWRHICEGVQIGAGSMTGTIVSGHKLVVDTTNIPYSITEQNLAGEVIIDRYGDCDFSDARFVFAGEGHNRYVVVGTVQGFAVQVEARLEYESV